MAISKKTWIKPEATVARASDALIGNDSRFIDQYYPASNGATQNFS